MDNNVWTYGHLRPTLLGQLGGVDLDKILSRRDPMTNKKLMQRSEMQSLSEMIKTQRWRLAGHVLRQPEEQPKQK